MDFLFLKKGILKRFRLVKLKENFQLMISKKESKWQDW